MEFSKFVSISLVLMPTITIASSWTYSYVEDGFSDTTQHRAVISLEKSKAFGFVRCSGEKNLDVAFSLDAYIGSDNKYPVRYRFDKSPVIETLWSVSTNGTEVFVSSGEVIGFSRALAAGKELLLEVTDFRGTPKQLKYPLTGTTETVGKVLAACDIPVQAPKLSIDPSKVTPIVKSAMANWTPKETKCNKASLKILGYEVENTGSNITAGSYYAMQKYFDKTYLRECGPETKSVYEKTYDCQSKERFMSSRVVVLLNRDAANEDKATFAKNCS